MADGADNTDQVVQGTTDMKLQDAAGDGRTQLQLHASIDSARLTVCKLLIMQENHVRQ